MINQLFYPIITRRTQYSVKPDGTYYKTYSYYHTEISEDCHHRCVYCDITELEMGGEGMVLDHFRPYKYFEELVNDPNNLVLSCPKCNGLKSSHWPAGNTSASTHNGVSGFIDPFIDSMRNYFSVQTDGLITSLKPPAKYIERKLSLNRKTRVDVRHWRILRQTAKDVLEASLIEFETKSEQWQDETITNEEFQAVCQKHGELLRAYLALNN